MGALDYPLIAEALFYFVQEANPENAGIFSSAFARVEEIVLEW